ncbi:MAG TPA: glycosyltransferase family 4 protein [Gaiellaceae bacterium]|nr:glycosyltransferase family 4 protein [Gaiellaceae bacterium]
MTRRVRVLVLNQYYWPGVEATAHLLSQLCEALAADFEVTVVTACLRDTAEAPERLERNGVKIIRVHSTVFDRSRLAARAANYVSFLAGSLWAGLGVPRPDVVLCMTDPPLIANIALPVARRFGASLVVITQDVFPEIAVQLGRLEQPLVVGALRRAIGFSLRRADRVVAIGDTMRERIAAKGVEPARIAVIPNWGDTESLTPLPTDNEWARSYGLDGRFVVMHSGNVGFAQDLDTLIRSSTFLRDLEDLSVMIVGSGARREILRSLAQRVAAGAVRFLPYQDAGLVSMSLSAADIHFVGLVRGLAGYVVPSRVYGIMAVARPLIVSADDESETARLVREVECGIVVPPGRPDLVAEAIREAHAGSYDLDAMGQRGSEFVRREATREVAVGRYRALIGELAGVLEPS